MEESIIIASINYSGEVANIIFRPDVENILIDLGNQTLPYTFNSYLLNPPRYVYGDYTITMVSGGCVYFLTIVRPSPTPTPTLSVTPTMTVTPSQTPTLTPTASVTPSLTKCYFGPPTSTPTNTLTPTNTRTPNVTPSLTKCYFPTQTPTPSRT